MQIHYATGETCAEARGAVVVIDVVRAFTTAAYALASGAHPVYEVSTPEEAFALRERLKPHTPAVLMGEVMGVSVPGFDYDNSPSQLVDVDLSGKAAIHRTSAGSQGVVRSQNASHLLASSFVVAGATVRWLRDLAPDSVTFVVTGSHGDFVAVEDQACAEYLAACLLAAPDLTPDPAPYLERASRWQPFPGSRSPKPPYWEDDLRRTLELDRFSFAMPVRRQEGLFFLEAEEIG
jgi:2-phosphosulfolactate phosphatase